MKILILSFLALLLMVAGPAGAQVPNANGLGWRWQNPLPQGNALHDIDAIDDLIAAAVGDDGTILRTTDGGATWVPQSSGTQEDLRSVAFVGPSFGVAVGSGGTILRTTDAGVTWLRQSAPATGTLLGVTFANALSGFAVEDIGRILRTTDGGAQWNPVTVAGTAGLLAVHFRNALRGFAVGLNGGIFRTNDGGITWEARPSPTTQPLHAVFFPTDQFGVAVGLGGVVLTTQDGGGSWLMTNLGITIPFRGVSFGDSLHGIAVGLPGINFHTSDGGSSWFMRPSGTQQALSHASFTDADNGFAVGEMGAILHTEDGGVNWESQSSGTTQSLFGVSFGDLSRGVVVGDMGMILRTTNAGTTWWTASSGTAQTLWGVSMATTSVGTAVGTGGTILRTTNGGATWTAQAGGTTQQLLSVSHADALTAMAVGGSGTIRSTTDGGGTWSGQSSGTSVSLNAVQMVSTAVAYSAGGGGLVLKTTNGGTTWTSLSTGTTAALYGLSFTDALTGTVVGAGGVLLRTTDGGASWMFQSGGTSLTLNGVSFASATRGIAVGYGGLIIRTLNGGVTWSRQSSGTSNYLAAIDLVDASHGTVVGFGGTILYTDTGGDAPAPGFSATTGLLDFGEVTLGTSRTDSVTVTNNGTAALMIEEVESDDSRFSVTPTSAILYPGWSRKFAVTFTPVSTGLRTASLLFHSNAESSPDTVGVRGTGITEGLGTFLSITPDTIVAKDLFTGKLLKPVKRGKRLYPNWANLLSEVVIQGGFQPGSSQSDHAGGMRVGLSWMYEHRPGRWKPRPDSASMHCWVRLGRWSFTRSSGSAWSNLQKTLADNTGLHTGRPRGLDSTGTPGEGGRRVLVKQLSKLCPKKHSNRLFAELVALKFNIAASALGKTPVGFGELEYDREGSICDDLSVVEIAARADSMLTFWRGRPQAEYDSLHAVLCEINRAFNGPLDTLSFEADEELILAGAVELNSVPFMKRGDTPPQRLTPTTRAVEDPGDFGEEDFDGEEGTPVAAKLYQNYPNPFNPTTAIPFRLGETSRVTIRIYDMLGRQVAELLTEEELEDGYNEVLFQADGLSSGVYFCRVDARGLGDEALRSVLTNKMLLLK